MKKVVWLAGLLSFCFFSSTAMAITESSPDATGLNSGQALEDMVVTTSRVGEMKKEVTQTLKTIDKFEIEASGASDLGDLLAEEGIGHIQKYPVANTSVGIRTFRTDPMGNDLVGRVLILLNGRRAATGNLTKFLTKNIERIEIIRGPGAVQYGSAGMGGVINIITKRGDEDLEGFVEAGFGSYGLNEQSAGASGKTGKFDYSLAATRQDQNDYETADDGDYDNTYVEDQINCSINLGYEFLPNNRIGVIWNYYDVKTGNWNSWDYNTPNINYVKKDNNSFDIIYDGAVASKTYTWQARYFNTEDNNNYYYPDGSSTDSIGKSEQNGAQAQVTGDWDIAQLTVGADWVNYKIESSGEIGKYDNLAFFALSKFRLMDDRLILSTGARLDTYEIKGGGNKDDQEDITCSVGAAYLITDHLKFRVNFGQAFVMPTAEAMLMDMSYYGGMYIYEANPDLDPERSKTYEAGVEYETVFIRAALTGFYTDYKDKIETLYVGFDLPTWTTTYTYYNVDEATISGIEGEFSVDFGGLLSWGMEIRPFVKFVYLDQYEDGETGDDLLFVSDRTLSAGLRVSSPDHFNVTLTVAYTGDQDINVYDAYFNTLRVTKGDFTVTNLAGNYKIFQQSNGNAVWFHGEVNNLFDKDYEYVNGYPMPGRNFYASLKYTF